MSIENVGEELAFDVQVRALSTRLASAPMVTMLHFPLLLVLGVNDTIILVPVIDPPISSLGENPALSQPQRFLQVLLMAQEQNAKRQGMTEKNICRDLITVRYRKVRGRQFEMEFVALGMRDFIRLEVDPHGSLVSRQLRERPVVSGNEFFSVSG